MGNKDNIENKKREIWEIWDTLFSSGLLSFFMDSQEARDDEKKFKQMLLQLLLGINFTVIMFSVGFWILY